MKSQKLTYSGTRCNSYIYFAFDADFFDTNKVTTELSIEPTSVKIKNQPAPKSTTWKYQIDVGSEIDLETPMEKLIDIFEPKIDQINKLKEVHKLSTRLQLVIDIDINPESSTPYFGLNKRIINFLDRTETDIDFDLYKSDTIGIIK